MSDSVAADLDGTAPFLQDMPFTSSDLDREGHLRSGADRIADALADPATRVLDVADGRVPTRDGRLELRPPRPEDAQGLAIHLGRRAGTAHVAVIAPGSPPSPTDAAADREEALDAAVWSDLRGVAASLAGPDASLVATAVALANWHAAHPRCSRCGAATEPAAAGWTRRCPEDGSEHHPRTDPAVIVAVTDADDRILLARNVGWPEGRLSLVAGFVEPGETLAAAVAREVGEEVGLHVTDVRYVADQPWPFPASLMVGFTARASGTETTLLDGEIAEARWFSRADYAAAVRAGELRRPVRLSISARLVEGWLGRSVDTLV